MHNAHDFTINFYVILPIVSILYRLILSLSYSSSDSLYFYCFISPIVCLQECFTCLFYPFYLILVQPCLCCFVSTFFREYQVNFIYFLYFFRNNCLHLILFLYLAVKNLVSSYTDKAWVCARARTNTVTV